MSRHECVWHSKLWLFVETGTRRRLRPPNEKSNANIFGLFGIVNTLTFQMNGDHPYIIDKKRDAENTTFCKQYTDAVSFRMDYPKFNATFHKIGDDSCTMCILVGRSWTFDLIRKNIGNQLGLGMNKTKHLELYKKNSSHQYECLYDNYKASIMSYGATSKHFNSHYRLASYDARKRVPRQHVYKLDIYVSNEHTCTASDVLQYEPLKCGNSIWLRYDDQFVVKDFVNHLKNNGYLSSNAMDKYLPLVCANNNTLTSYSRCYTMNETCVEGNCDTVVPLNFYIMLNARTNNLDEDDQAYKLKIRFTNSTMSSITYYRSTNTLVGIPYIVSYKGTRDLQSVIDRSDFDSWVRQNISSCYVYKHVGESVQASNLARKSRSYGHLSSLKYTKQCLIIKLKKHFLKGRG
eukprot:449665_1